MMRRVITAREQYELLSPWLHVATTLWRGIPLDPMDVMAQSVLYHEDFNDPDFADDLLENLDTGRDGHSLGTHWSTEHDVAADTFSGAPMGGLDVLVGADWDDNDEDLDRTGTQGDWPAEYETTLRPGALVNVHTVRVRRPGEDRWQDIEIEPRQMMARSEERL